MSKKIRVLMIATSKLDRGGIDSYLMMLVKNWDKKRIHVDFVVHTNEIGSSEEAFKKYGCRIFKLPRAGQHPIQYYRKLRYIINKGKYDIVHRHGDASVAFVGLMVAKHAGVKVRIMHSHNNDWRHYLVHKLLRPLILYYATDLFACSKDAGEWMYGFQPFKVMNNGIDTVRFQYNEDDRKRYRQELGLTEKNVLINVGRLAYQKNQSWIIKLAEKIKEENIIILIVGDGPLEGELRREIKEKNIGNKVKLLGARDDIPELLSASDIAILPSHYEGLGIALVEAQCSGLPCIASKKVAHEVDFGAVSFVDLSYDEWEGKIVELINIPKESYDRHIAFRNVENHGYSAEKAAKMVMHEYISAIERENRINA